MAISSASNLARRLIEELNQRYPEEENGGPLDPTELAPPSGTFLVAYVDGVGRCEAAHVRRAGRSGTGYQAEYSRVPLTRSEHAVQHQRGKFDCLSTFATTFQPQTNLDAKAWFDRKRIESLRRWIASSSPDNA